MRVHGAPPEAIQASAAFDAKQFLRSHLLDLAPYTPIEPFEVSMDLYLVVNAIHVR